MKELTLDYITITVEYRTQGSISVLFNGTVADLFNNCRLSNPGREYISGDRIKVDFKK